MFRELWGCVLCVCVCVCVFSGRVGPTGEQKTSRQDVVLKFVRPILAPGGGGGGRAVKQQMEKSQSPRPSNGEGDVESNSLKTFGMAMLLTISDHPQTTSIQPR